MNEVTVIISNVDGQSEGLLWELKRSGVPEGTLISGVIDWKTNAVYFEDDPEEKCVTYIGHTCYIVTPLKPADLTEGTVVHRRDNPHSHFVITKILTHTVVLKAVSTAKQNRHTKVEYMCILIKEYFWVRRMEFEEYEVYLETAKVL